MNAQRRTEINNVRKDIEESLPDIKTLFELILSWKEKLESARDDEQQYYDDMPESFQQSTKGEAAELAVAALEETISKLDNFVPLEEIFDEVLQSLETAVE